MPHIRKETPGSDSFGNEWAEAGEVVEVSVDQATDLLNIPDGGFSEVLPDELNAVSEEDDHKVGEQDEEPAADTAPDAASKPRRTRTRTSKTA